MATKHASDVPHIEWTYDSCQYRGWFINTERPFVLAALVWCQPATDAHEDLWVWQLGFSIGAEEKLRTGTAACRGAAMQQAMAEIYKAGEQVWWATKPGQE